MWVLVKWLEEDKISVIPSAWVLQPDPVPESGFPVEGLCYWKKRTSTWDTLILAVSDVKAALESKSRLISGKNGEEGEVGKLKRNQTGEDEGVKVTTAKRRKQDRENQKSKKKAEIAAADEMAKTIFDFGTTAVCTTCADVKEQLQHVQSELKAAKLELHLAEVSLAAKEVQLEAKEAAVKTLQNDLQCATSCQDFPLASEDSIIFLEKLAGHYRGLGVPQVDIIDDDSSSEEEEEYISEYELKRNKNIRENAELLDTLGLKPNRQEKQGVTGKQKAAAKASCSAPSARTKLSSGAYQYTVTPADLQLEQQAFAAGVGKKELVEGFGVYIKFIQLEQAEQSSKCSPTGLMRALTSVWYTRNRLAGCSANSGIDMTIRTAVFRYCQQKYPGTSIEKLKRDLTSKCGEERRKIMH